MSLTELNSIGQVLYKRNLMLSPPRSRSELCHTISWPLHWSITWSMAILSLSTSTGIPDTHSYKKKLCGHNLTFSACKRWSKSQRSLNGCILRVIKGRQLRNLTLKDMTVLQPSMIAVGLTKLTSLTCLTHTRVTLKAKEWGCMKKAIAVS